MRINIAKSVLSNISDVFHESVGVNHKDRSSGRALVRVEKLLPHTFVARNIYDFERSLKLHQKFLGSVRLFKK